MTSSKALIDLSPEKLTELPTLYLRLILTHHGLWFTETKKRLGLEAALEAETGAWQRIFPRVLKRMGPHVRAILEGEGGGEGKGKSVGEVEGDDAGPTPATNRGLAIDGLEALLVDMAKTWLAMDGVWFQAVERKVDIENAMACNEAAWHSFAFTEARRIRSFLGLGEHSGFEGLTQALDYRLYSWLNRQSCHRIDDSTMVFEMNECRVQTARERRGLPDYPCKKAGLIEYTRFAEGFDDRLTTECLGCPPDVHPREWYCKWRFSLDG